MGKDVFPIGRLLERPSWSVAAASWWSPIANPPRCPRPPRPPHCVFAMSLLLDDVELGQTT
eukprot:1498403-Prymnesium_polylepis.1